MLTRPLFVCWGKRGAAARLSLDVTRAASRRSDVDAAVSIAKDNELAFEFDALGDRVQRVETFRRGYGAVTQIWRMPQVRADLERQIAAHKPDAVIVLMPHVWTPLTADLFRGPGRIYASIVHDSAPHPGDPTALVTPLLVRDAARADRIVTLSDSVADALVARGFARADQMLRLYHPTYDFTPPGRADGQGSLRVLFFGRVLPYKGLARLVEAVEILHREGVAIKLGVFGEGALGALAPRLRALGAEVENRWIGEQEIGAVLARYDVMALPYDEASQSGVAAAGNGAGLALAATPVGGLMEQVAHETDGLIASDLSTPSYANILRRLAHDPALLSRLKAGAKTRGDARSMDAFLTDLLTGLAR